MLTFTDEQLREKLKSETGHDASHLQFHSFTDVEQSVRNQLETTPQSSITYSGNRHPRFRLRRPLRKAAGSEGARGASGVLEFLCEVCVV